MPLRKPSLALSLIGVSVIVTFFEAAASMLSSYCENLLRTESNIEWALEASNRNLTRQIELMDLTRLPFEIETISSTNPDLNELIDLNMTSKQVLVVTQNQNGEPIILARATNRQSAVPTILLDALLRQGMDKPFTGGFKKTHSLASIISRFFGTDPVTHVVAATPVQVSYKNYKHIAVVSGIEFEKDAFAVFSILNTHHYWPVFTMFPLLGLLIGISFWITKRLRILSAGMKKVADDRYDFRLPQHSVPDLDQLHGSFNKIANNGREGVDRVLKGGIDLVLMDLQMPVMGGEDASIEIRKSFNLELQPIIVAMTGHALAGVKESCVEIGMDAFLTKPISIEDVKKESPTAS